MNFNDKFMQEAIIRINELQTEIKEKSKTIEGAQQYIQQQVKLYEESEILKNKAKNLQEEGQRIANDFFF
ncbi:hypothetical protein MLC52_04890 [Sulfurimonas sp. NW15]|uniref:hypothetical protein n=1 Tax=Sulfurimonas sp. NW15 TaxID=2922729 RepID=UPI003DA94E13